MDIDPKRLEAFLTKRSELGDDPTISQLVKSSVYSGLLARIHRGYFSADSDEEI